VQQYATFGHAQRPQVMHDTSISSPAQNRQAEPPADAISNDIEIQLESPDSLMDQEAKVIKVVCCPDLPLVDAGKHFAETVSSLDGLSVNLRTPVVSIVSCGCRAFCIMPSMRAIIHILGCVFACVLGRW
jgi:hypothetical protein